MTMQSRCGWFLILAALTASVVFGKMLNCSYIDILLLPFVFPVELNSDIARNLNFQRSAFLLLSCGFAFFITLHFFFHY